MTQTFGSGWTQIKLDVLSGYLDAYITALKKQPFSLCYVDAFAGSGEVQLKTGQTVQGSPMLALERNFDRYFFLERNPVYFAQLQERIQSHPCYADKKDKIVMECCDSNKPLQRITEKLWLKESWRGVMFLDPYALSVEWASLQQISQTGIFDVWYLFPIMAMLRCLRKDGGVDPQCINALNRILGTEEWQSILYYQQEEPQYRLPFDDMDTADIKIKRVDTNLVQKYVLDRLISGNL